MWRMRQRYGHFELVSDEPPEAVLQLDGGFDTDDQAIAFLDRISYILNHSQIASEGLAPIEERDLAHAKAELYDSERC